MGDIVMASLFRYHFTFPHGKAEANAFAITVEAGSIPLSE